MKFLLDKMVKQLSLKEQNDQTIKKKQEVKSSFKLDMISQKMNERKLMLEKITAGILQRLYKNKCNQELLMAQAKNLKQN